MTDLPKTYDPQAVEQKWYGYWERNKIFKVDPKSGRKPYCIIMPPPNITGQLHMGHGLQDSIQDMLIRMKRMQGFESHWQPGKDHAGIATQNVVEKQLAKEGTNRHEIGRDKFIERAWQWKEEYGNRIFEQKRLLGDCSDWERERFTLSPELTRVVHKVFKHLFDKGLIYRGNYIVNWCPRCHTAISDEEVFHEDHHHHLWYFKYPFKNGKEHVTVATTRPETMLGDAGVAVNPKDDRFKDLIGEKLILPLAEREISVVADAFVDPEFGTGQVKVTPAHDPNDFEMGRRHGLEELLVIDEDGAMNEKAPERFRGMDRFKARDEVVKAMDELGLLAKTEDYDTSIGHCQRCKTIIEPYLSKQWFVKMKPLAEPAIKAVRDGRIKFYPARWAKIYFAWMEEIRDWCISRQLWWGHRIPVWYCEDCGAVIVEVDEPEKCSKCGSTSLRQDEDVLDTWFSSWLWAFTSLGWPDDREDYDFWYPSDVMVTGYDIIFFWVARMIIAGLEFTDEIPFRDVYITGMIKDELGRWMSKSLGNGIDPQDMVEEYGGDAVRFTLISLASEGQDIKLAPSRFEGGRNFANKLWNSYRFLFSQIDKLEKPLKIGKVLDISDDAHLSERWIISRFRRAVEKVYDSAGKYRVNDMMNAQYDFIWKEYCDWLLEIVKVRTANETDETRKNEILGFAVGLFEAFLRLLHPGMCFITEEMWQGLKGFFDHCAQTRFAMQPATIMNQPYPKPDEFQLDEQAENEMEFLQKAIGAVRNIRSEMRIPPGKKSELIISNCVESRRRLIEDNLDMVLTLASTSGLKFDSAKPPYSATAVVEDIELFIPLEGLIDLDIERKRIDKEIGRLEGVIKGAEKKLSNKKFVANAPENVVAHERTKLEDCKAQLAVVKRNREMLG